MLRIAIHKYTNGYGLSVNEAQNKKLDGNYVFGDSKSLMKHVSKVFESEKLEGEKE